MKILVINNHDSFIYTLVRIVEEIIKEDVIIVSIDKITLTNYIHFDAVILSPGPGIPKESLGLVNFIQKHASNTPILGVCLGHQAIIEAFGGTILQLKEVHHGTSSNLKLCVNNDLYNGLKDPIHVGLYHSWAIDKKSLPKEFEITAEDQNGIIMSFKHSQYPLHGVQFHPESILTPQGKQILVNWINTINEYK